MPMDTAMAASASSEELNISTISRIKSKLRNSVSLHCTVLLCFPQNIDIYLPLSLNLSCQNLN